jgi:hypothetical protein|nr:MAG TPA: hypothetical protein [Caudoviricetes sp.]
MIKRISLEDFRNSGMLWYINQQLHLFGMALVMEFDEQGKPTSLYPTRCKFRGFPNEVSDKGYKNLTQYLVNNCEELLKDCE